MTPEGRAALAAVAQQQEPVQQPLQTLPPTESEPLQGEWTVTKAEGGPIEALKDLEEEVDYGDDSISLEEAEVGDEAEVVSTGRNIAREKVEEEGDVSSEEDIGLEKEVMAKELGVDEEVGVNVVAEETVEKIGEGDGETEVEKEVDARASGEEEVGTDEGMDVQEPLEEPLDVEVVIGDNSGNVDVEVEAEEAF